MPQVVRRERRHARGRARPGDGGAEAVGAEALEDLPLRYASSSMRTERPVDRSLPWNESGNWSQPSCDRSAP